MLLRFKIFTHYFLILLVITLFGLKADNGIEQQKETESFFFAAKGEVDAENFSDLCQKVQDINQKLKAVRFKITCGTIGSTALLVARSFLNPIISGPCFSPIIPPVMFLKGKEPFLVTATAVIAAYEEKIATRLVRFSEDYNNKIVFYGQTGKDKLDMVRKFPHETNSVLIEVNWSDVKKEYAYKDSACIAKFFDQIKAEFKEACIKAKKDSPTFILLVHGADELVDDSSVTARNFNAELEKRSKNSLDLFLLEVNRKTVSTGNVLHGLVGKSPSKIRYIVKQLNETNGALKKGEALSFPVCKNRLLLYGPPGNGKTTLARKIAEQTGSYHIAINTPEIMNKYYGGSAAKIKEIFDNARAYADANNQTVVISFDEIDAIADGIVAERKSEPLAALQELWYQMDLIQNDSRFFMVGMTNAEEVHQTLKTRFGNNIEKVGAPDAMARRAALQLYKKQYTGSGWNKKMLEKLVNGTNDEKISIRFLEDYIREVSMVAKLDNDGIITDELAWKIFEEMKAKYIKTLWQRAQEEVKKKENQDTALRLAAVFAPVLAAKMASAGTAAESIVNNPEVTAKVISAAS